MSNINFKFEGIGHFIKDNMLKVPSYQRPYSWNDDNIQALFEDINGAKENDYFIGTIVVKKDNKKLEIIDGQQRIATLYIFYIALRDFLKEKKDDSFSVVESEYVASKDMRSKALIPKLELGTNDNHFFRQSLVEGVVVDETQRESHDRIKAAYDISMKEIKRLYNLNNQNFNRLFDLVDYLKDKLKIIVVTVSSEDNAFTIFETLNDRGIDLTKTDLIKNLLFNRAIQE